MKALTLTIVGAVALSCVSANFLQDSGIMTSSEEFLNYIAKYGKSYATKDEFQKRAQQFLKAKARIMLATATPTTTFRLGLNEFSDWTDEEFQTMLGSTDDEPEEYKQHIKILEENGLPESVDWRQKGVVNPVKNQGKCGSCWSFSTAAGVESHYAIQFGQLLSLSEQQLVDCSSAYGNAGCNGGLATQGYDYAKKYGLQLEDDYPYKAADETCKRDASKVKAYVSEFYKVTPRSPAQLKAAIAKGPVSVSVDASTFRDYASGILNQGCGTSLNHAIVAVGYGKENGQEYYIVRNSWGPSWGENGYIRIAIKDGEGVCGVQIRPSYPETRKP